MITSTARVALAAGRCVLVHHDGARATFRAAGGVFHSPPLVRLDALGAIPGAVYIVEASDAPTGSHPVGLEFLALVLEEPRASTAPTPTSSTPTSSTPTSSTRGRSRRSAPTSTHPGDAPTICTTGDGGRVFRRGLCRSCYRKLGPHEGLPARHPGPAPSLEQVLRVWFARSPRVRATMKAAFAAAVATDAPGP
jgi:hypothetical protein